MKKLNLLTVKFGDKYVSSWVNKLYESTPKNKNFYCYTDNPEGLHPDIKIIPIDDTVEGVFHKLAMFQKDFGGIKGKIMYLDLDVVIQKDITPLYNNHNTFTIVQAYWKPLKELNKGRQPLPYHIKTDMNVNSSVMIWNQNENIHIWESFMKDPERYMHIYLGIDRFLFWEKKTGEWFKELDIYSRRYGINAMNGWYNIWKRPYYLKDAYICLMNGETTKKDYVELQEDINNPIQPHLYVDREAASIRS